MKSIEISSSVKNGKLFSNVNRLYKIIRSFEGKDILIKVSLLTEKRSNKQNAYYWGVIIPIIQELLENSQGVLLTKKETHEFLKSQFNYTERVNENTGEILNFPKSTTENTKKEMEDYHEKIRRFSEEWFNVKIPLPNEQIKIE